ncbi:S8 family serine peptidase [Nocardioides sp. CPCC 206347]|uniref:S8 family serine peptidase n=1 Tax=unclassified Nocardioides TaxID=2615069 RepID=UPI00361DB349
MHVSVRAARRAAASPPSRRQASAIGLLFFAIVIAGFGADPASAAPKPDDPSRPGPADGPRGKRVPGAEHPGDLPDYESESARVGNPNAGEPVPNQYIVVFRPGLASASDTTKDIVAKNNAKLKFSYGHAISGFAAVIDPDRIDNVRNHPNVASVEQDYYVGPEDIVTPAPSWGQDRIDQRDLPLSNSYNDFNEGAGIHAYIIDTGIRRTHGEFTGRVGNGYDAVTAGGTANDCNGHGTHVASTVAGATYGVADKAIVHPVRVLDCNGSGSNAGVIAGIDWVRANAIKPAVANMSLGGGVSSSLDTALNNAITAGITFVVAAGNSNANACNYSPARVPAAITVGATTNTDARASFSNFGTCLDIFAPGQNITAGWSTGDTAVNTISGTSMASPHVAGAAALFLNANPGATPSAVRAALVNNSTFNKITAAGTGSPNHLLYTGFIGGGATPPPPPPPPPPSGLINGGFESGTTGWTQYSAAGYPLIGTSKPRTGSYSVWALGYNSGTERISQPVVVSGTGTLTYWWWMNSSEGTTTAFDYMYVRVRNTAGTLLATVRTRSNTATRAAWVSDSISLSAYAGQQVVISFEFSSDSSLATSFYVDDVGLS